MRRRNISIEEQILYEDKEILVCRKLPGIPVQSGRVGIPDMENAVKSYLVKKGESAYLGIIHRLDQPVQGVVVFAKNQKAAGELSRQIRQGEMEKIYLAAVEKIPDQTQGRLEDELEKLPGTNLSRVADRKTSSSKKAVLEYKVLKTQGKRRFWRYIFIQEDIIRSECSFLMQDSPSAVTANTILKPEKKRVNGRSLPCVRISSLFSSAFKEKNGIYGNACWKFSDSIERTAVFILRVKSISE